MNRVQKWSKDTKKNGRKRKTEDKKKAAGDVSRGFGKYYAFLSNIEEYENENAYDLDFELVPLCFIDAVVSPNSKRRKTDSWKQPVAKDSLAGVPIYFLKLKKVKADTKISGSKVKDLLLWENEHFFYIVCISKQDEGIQGSFYTSEEEENDNQGSTRTLSTWVRPRTRRDTQILNFLLKPKLPLLRSYRSKTSLTAKVSAGALGVMDVGAGGCNLLFDTKGKAICYFDVGRGSGAPDALKTKPKSGGKFKKDPIIAPVILSHWDRDHWYLAKRTAYAQQFQSQRWIVPDPTMHKTPSCAIYFNNVGSNLAGIMKKPYAKIPFDIADAELSLTKYTGNNQAASILNNNRKTIAMVLKIGKSKVFMPGDASFPYIFKGAPGLLKKRFDCLLATHHGSSKHKAVNQIPEPTKSGLLIYSYGINAQGTHYYDHPNQNAVDAYRKIGWKYQYSTAEYDKVNKGGGSRGNILVTGKNSKGIEKSISSRYHNTAFKKFKPLPLPQ